MTTRIAHFVALGTRPGSLALVPALAAAAMAAATLAGCESSGSSESAVLTPTDFRSNEPPTSSVAEPHAAKPAPATKPPLAGAVAPASAARTPTVTTAEAASGGVGDVAVLVGEPEVKADPNAKPSSEVLVIDTMVGQVNGKPVFANQFFHETRLDGVLRAKLYTTPSAAAWKQEARTLIANQLQGRMLDELLLSEARALLTPDEKRGLINFLTRLRENLASASHGSAIAAEENLQSTDNTTLDAKAKNERDKVLLRILMGRYIEPHVNVSWRDVQKQYDRDYAKYNPLPEAYLRMVYVTKSRTDNVEKIKSDLAEGKSFEEVARSPLNEYEPAKGGQLPTSKIETTYAETKLVGLDIVNKEAQKLKPGQTGGPIEFNTLVIWIHLDKIDQKPAKTLEDAQLEIESRLKAQRTQAEVQRFFVRLVERGGRTDENIMIERLISVAQERYLDNGQFPKSVVDERAKAQARPRPETPTPPGLNPPPTSPVNP